MNIPEDVIIEIISYLLPLARYSADLHSYRSGEPDNPTALLQYRQNKAIIGRIRLASRQMNAIVTPFFYEEVVIYLPGPPSIEKLNMMFSTGGHFIRTLVIEGRAYNIVRTSNYARVIKQKLPHNAPLLEAVGKGLEQCRRLRRLEALGDHRMFTSRGWVKRLSMNLPDLVSIVYDSENDISLDHVLVAFGARLESLTIINSRRGRLSSSTSHPLHLPAAFSNLRKLILDGTGRMDYARLVKVFSRIPSASDQKSPLRELVITGGLFRGSASIEPVGALMQKALPRDVGLHLSALHFLPSSLLNLGLLASTQLPIEVRFHSIAQILSKACPNLTTLAIPCSQFCSEMYCIPAKVQHLTVAIITPQTDNRLVVDRNARAQSLQTLSFFPTYRKPWAGPLRLVIKGSELPFKRVTHPYLKNGIHGNEVTFGNKGGKCVGKCGSATEV